MAHGIRIRCFALFCVAAAASGGCADRKSTAVTEIPSGTVSIVPGPAASDSQADVDEVCEVAAMLFDRPQETVRPSTTLSELTADESAQLDLIFELQERFDVGITEE